MLNVIFMKVIGWMIKLMDMENICTKMVQLIKANGKMISKMAKVLKLGLMERFMRASILMAKKMG